MKAIFLDIDGVLNTPSSESRCGEYIGIDDEKVEKLNDEQSRLFCTNKTVRNLLPRLEKIRNPFAPIIISKKRRTRSTP